MLKLGCCHSVDPYIYKIIFYRNLLHLDVTLREMISNKMILKALVVDKATNGCNYDFQVMQFPPKEKK